MVSVGYTCKQQRFQIPLILLVAWFTHLFVHSLVGFLGLLFFFFFLLGSCTDPKVSCMLASGLPLSYVPSLPLELLSPFPSWNAMLLL